MRLTFLDRAEERKRLRALLRGRGGALGVLYGRRRCGKSRLLLEVLPPARSVYYVADDRQAGLQRQALATEIGRLVPGFGDVSYPGWEPLLSRWAREAPPGAALALDEFPSLVASSPELPSLLQKQLDGPPAPRTHLLLAGSSQRLMHGLVLDRSAPLFGRALEVLKVGPLGAGWIGPALRLRRAQDAVEAFAVWGGVPRYWELALAYPNRQTALRELVLGALGVLHEEPRGLLLDDWREATQALSILTLVGQGCHRSSEIAGRLGKPATSLSRPLAQLVDLGFLRRDVPFGEPASESKRGLYRIADPFLTFWFRHVEPNRSRTEGGLLDQVSIEVEAALPSHVGGIYEELVRLSVPRGRWLGSSWGRAAAYWGPGTDHRPLEVDVVAASLDGRELLVGEVKWHEKLDWRREAALLRAKAGRLPMAAGRRVRLAIWAKQPRLVVAEPACFGPAAVLRALR